MTIDTIVHPSDDFKQTAHISTFDEYQRLYRRSIDDPDGFWSDVAKEFYWKVKPHRTSECNFDVTRGPVQVKWFAGGVTNMCYNVLDRIIVEHQLGEKIAYYWEGNESDKHRTITYNELRADVCRFANVLKKHGVGPGDRVAVYMPVTIELVVVMLACARIGAVHSVVFAGFSAESLADRILDADCKLLVTADASYRGPKFIPLKQIADSAIEICLNRGHQIAASIVFRHSELPLVDENNNQLLNWNPKLDCWWHQEMAEANDSCSPVWLPADDPLFILYTSGSTGKPKGVVHTIGGYLAYSYLTFKYVFDYHPDDVVFCTADLGWMAGHTINVYACLANGTTSVLFEGNPLHPGPDRVWKIIEQYRVNTFYGSPTLIRTLMKFGDRHVKAHDRSSLRLLGTAGEPINPEAWCWFYHVVGEGRCPIVDTYWQTETGAPMLTSLPGCVPMKPGSATVPFFGVVPAILDDNGRELNGQASGHLVFKKPWPGLAKTIHGDHSRFETTYFCHFPGYYMTGDGVTRDSDGYYWIAGRTDDMVNVSGHLLSTAQVESAVVGHPSIAEAAAVSADHPVKGECLYCFVVLKDGFDYTEDLERQIKQRVREKIGALADPDFIRPVSGLPKTRSGKIMRRVLAKVTRNDREIGDISAIADESVLDELFQDNIVEAR